jgi:hypothetical protein
VPAAQLNRLDLLQMRLGDTCTSLRQASLAWFPEVTATLWPDPTDVASLAAWLKRYQGEKLLPAALRTCMR